MNAKYFKYINKVYVHNQARKFDIGLEKQWVIPSTYFCVYTSQVGMNLTDSWKVIKWHHKDGGHVLSATEFLDITVYDVIRKAEKQKET